VMLSEERRAVMDTEREVLQDLVELYLRDPSQLDPVHRKAHDDATDDRSALRAVVDQVASLSDARALALHAHDDRMHQATTAGGMP
jgi:dGTPase